MKVYKLKHIAAAFIAGLIIATSLPAGAAIQQYVLTKSDVKIVYEGTPIVDEAAPNMLYGDKNMIPASTVRKIFTSAGIPFTWDSATNEIRIGSTMEPGSEWVTLSAYENAFGALPFVKSTEEGQIFSVQTSKGVFNFKFQSGKWWISED